MATDISNGITLIESNTTDNQDWITAGGDPEDIDLDNFTSGDDVWAANIVENIKPSPKGIGDFPDIPGWSSIDISLEEGHDVIDVEISHQGATFAATKTKLEDLIEFYRNHSKFSDNTTSLIHKYTTDSYLPHINNARTSKKYCAGRIVPASLSYYIEDTVLYARFKWRSVW